MTVTKIEKKFVASGRLGSKGLKYANFYDIKIMVSSLVLLISKNCRVAMSRKRTEAVSLLWHGFRLCSELSSGNVRKIVSSFP